MILPSFARDKGHGRSFETRGARARAGTAAEVSLNFNEKWSGVSRASRLRYGCVTAGADGNAGDGDGR